MAVAISDLPYPPESVRLFHFTELGSQIESPIFGESGKKTE
ncbi:hypothetical protein PLAN_30260 [Planktothrix rubescens CCAP 1459/22]|uniref:Uncharacterized protein n=1 Tax=Planktothrix rubescens CCAP 1459/22 TaxID=329571 RepID=A0A6J7ZK08_PLARU|nr:hypothetical protein PLAN_30260 [Planktothrix rubescens NIVA-CYA 18]